uniref:Uncharacterized protein n=1 Tax=Heterorhabditis bacteriophora TaxID=37862 RepID=A0A1I7WRC1_HETBA
MYECCFSKLRISLQLTCAKGNVRLK